MRRSWLSTVTELLQWLSTTV
uniref:Uncharacterized protein n=1 Tax=Zea mays TaxID=4577 RepID=B4FW04_MAIZE|nr:unknown [Zea mays]ACR37559.1 unknown [Zea mays]